MFCLMEEETIVVWWVGFVSYVDCIHIKFFLCKMSKGWKKSVLLDLQACLVLLLSSDVTVVKPINCYLLC